MATTTSSTKSGLFRSLTSKLVRKDEEGGTSLKPQRAGTLRSKAREQMRTGRPAVDYDARPPSLTIGDDGWGSDGKLYVKNLDHEHPPSSFNHTHHQSSDSSKAPLHDASPSSPPREHQHHHHHHSQDTSSPPPSSIRPIQRGLSAPSPYSLPLTSSNSNQPNPASPSRPLRQQPPSDAFRAPSRPHPSSNFDKNTTDTQEQTSSSSSSQKHAHFDTPSQGRARSHSHSQTSHTYSHSSSEASPPLPTSSNGYSLSESYAPASSMPRSKSGPDQRAPRLAVDTNDSGGYQPRPRTLVDGPGSAGTTPASSMGPRTPASAASGQGEVGAGKEGWAKVKRGMTLVRRGAREARAQEQAQLDPNRPPSPLRKAAAPKMYSPAELAMEIEKAEKQAAEQAAAAYRASSMVPRKSKQEAAEESRLTESAFY